MSSRLGGGVRGHSIHAIDRGRLRYRGSGPGGESFFVSALCDPRPRFHAQFDRSRKIPGCFVLVFAVDDAKKAASLGVEGVIV